MIRTALAALPITALVACGPAAERVDAVARRDTPQPASQQPQPAAPQTEAATRRPLPTATAQPQPTANRPQIVAPVFRQACWDLKPLQVGGWTVPPKPLHPVLPAISQGARQLGLRGIVVIATIIDAQGKVCDAQVVKGIAPSLPSLADEPARQSVLATTFTPATLEGRPVAVVFYMTVKIDATEPPPAGTTVAR